MLLSIFILNVVFYSTFFRVRQIVSIVSIVFKNTASKKRLSLLSLLSLKHRKQETIVSIVSIVFKNIASKNNK